MKKRTDKSIWRIISIATISLLFSATISYPAHALPNQDKSCSIAGRFTITNNIVLAGNGCQGVATIPVGVTAIAESAFSNAVNLSSVNIPEGVTSIGKFAFRNTKITSITIPSTVTAIRDNTFYSATLLTSVTLSSSLTSIAAGAFALTKLNSVVIPASVTSLGATAFNIVGLTRVTFLGNAPTTGINTFGAGAEGMKFYYPYGATGFTSGANIYNASSTNEAYYTATYNSKGGSSVTSETFYEGGSVATAPSQPTKEGDTFLGWSATDGGSLISFPYTPGVTNNITLYASWTGVSYSLSYNSNGGTTISSGSFVTGGSVVEPSAPTRSGYTFAGWSATDGGSAVSFPYSPADTNDITLYAKWTPLSFTVTFNSNSGTAVTSSSFVTDGSVVGPVAPTRFGYTFAGWSATDGGSAVSFPYSPGVLEGIVLWAKWTELPPVMGLSYGGNLSPGGLVSVHVSRVKGGCIVRIGWVDTTEDIEPVSRVVNSARKTGVISIAAPSVAGTYTLSTSIGGSCANGSAITLNQVVSVGKTAIIAAKLVTSSGFVLKAPTLAVSGTIKSGTVLLASKSFTVSLLRNGVEFKSMTGITDSSGAFNLNFAGTSYTAGNYTAVVTLAADSTYKSAQVTSAKLTLR